MAADRLVPDVGYDLSVTEDERDIVHAEVEAWAGLVSDARVGDGSYDPLTLVGAMLDGSSYDSISRGGTAATRYPFPVSNTPANQYEYDRKVAKLAWVVRLAQDLGFPVVVQRQADKYVYVEIGDPEAPEMIMALSHLDSPTASVSAAQLERWRDADGNLGTEGAYHAPYIKDGWIYGAGIQDDSGPTLATLLAAKALMEAGLPMDRRIRIAMGIYEDGGPGTPTAADTATFQSIPYNANPSFYDNWAYKNLNREEMPIAAYTSDSRFPVIVGNSGSVTPSVSMDLSADTGRAFRLTEATAGVTLREGDPTLKDIAYGSTTQIASRAIFTLDVTGATPAERERFVAAVTSAATARGWLPAAAGTTPKVQTALTGDVLTIEVNTDVAMEMPTPQYGKNAVVWGMSLLSEGLGALGVTAEDMQLKKAAEGITDLFFRDGVEGEAYIGAYMGIPADLLRNPSNGVPNLTFALMANINSETPRSFYTADSGSLRMPLYVRSMHVTADDASRATAAVTEAFESRGFAIGALGAPIGAGLYVTHDNPLTALQFGSYQASIDHDPAEFADPYALRDIVYPQGTTGGTLASNFRNKMTAFGAVIPGNERWWHTANERMRLDSAVQMTKMMADGMLEMARYSGPAGAQFMWADIPGMNADRADLDLLDVTIGTYEDASSAVGAGALGDQALLGATAFTIPMWERRGNNAPTAAAFALGHAPGGVYLPLDDPELLASTYVAPMRLEFKVERPAHMSDEAWQTFVDGGYGDFAFNVLVGDGVVPLAVPEGQRADQYFSSRVSATNADAVYLSVNLAIADAPYAGVQAVLADSKTDLYTVNPTFLETNADPFPERGAVEQRGFFLLGDGVKNAEFSSPDAVYVTVDNAVVDAEPSAVVTKLPGKTNELTITVAETRVDGSDSSVTATFTISNNAAGTYTVGEHRVYVETKGNTQVRKISIVE
ncbi:M20/M25/M40 family metallo-hydrolase [Microbacterium sp. zg.Y1090]|uniref:M20/M25/M40 family metallo-hydrolase n=1 Tax=Microbacterium TaxID=33882 RepID=UPI00214B2B67|nr:MULTISPECIES: M20/M25/M40 family metallo-hydrolase [unclassified Microbacterium]MCR2813048.1 M20/M25/M40 family metallo-hydrolase [Microbacterium sp. zg.Y1084]MCR2819362.1 M20/M25/M40 family metallo-hydrolase [Microbacterium sp. zg.Y1090]MDL5487279.1 M20/M25/M40 family metallo-hydrolase [Microbacterium sp. zg-Y1211]WIM28342.1 M20/M25/M40 family metallo-hydrolase [Microbacterium sp. zg-Y1090]